MVEQSPIDDEYRTYNCHRTSVHAQKGAGAISRDPWILGIMNQRSRESDISHIAELLRRARPLVAHPLGVDEGLPHTKQSDTIILLLAV